MRILIWNARGLGDDDKNETIQKTLLEANADFICLQETKLTEISVFKARNFLPPRLTEFVYQPSEGASAGLIIAWNPKNHCVQVIDSRKHAITVAVQASSDDTFFTLTNVYAPCDHGERTLFFDEIKQLQNDIAGPWMLAGDYNIYRYASKKNNSNINWGAMDELNAWINDLELMDIDIANSKFTWPNKRREPTLVKLDRILINLNWSQNFLHSECRTLLRQTSDHKPILLDTANTTPKTTCFRYEDYWLQNVELVAITKDKLTRGTRNMEIATRINHRLRMIRAATRAWLKSNTNQKIIRANLGHTILFFDTVEEWRTLNNYEYALRLVCTEKLQYMNLEESKHWRRRAKIKWCTLGDENTIFFHNMATYRYRKSKIKVLCHNQ
jgi:exonuclease III